MKVQSKLRDTCPLGTPVQMHTATRDTCPVAYSDTGQLFVLCSVEQLLIQNP